MLEAPRLDPPLQKGPEPRSITYKLISVPLKRHRNAIVTSIYAVSFPTVSAANTNEPPQPPPLSNQTCPPIFKFQSAFDYIIPLLMVFYIATSVLILRIKPAYREQVFNVSFGVGTLMGFLSFAVVLNCRDFPGGARATTLEIWFATILHVCAQYCYDNRENHSIMRYILSFVILLVGYAGAVFAFLSFHPLGILPFYTSFMSLIIWALHEYPQVAGLRLDRSNQPRGDEEQGILLRDGSSAASATQTQTQNDAPVNISVRRRNSNPARDPLPDPLIFYDDEDADNDNVAPLRRDANVGTPQN